MKNIKDIDTNSMTTFNLKLIPISQFSSLVTVSFNQVVFHYKQFASNIKEDYFSGFEQILYQINFFKEPAGSLFLYDRGPYTYSPAFNGDVVKRENQMHSFYSDELNQTFWVGFGSTKPNYVEIPCNILTLIENRVFKMQLVVDLYLIQKNNMGVDTVGYTIFSIENESGIIMIQATCFLDSIDTNEYIIKVHFYINGLSTTPLFFPIPIDSVKTTNLFEFTFTELNTNYYQVNCLARNLTINTEQISRVYKNIFFSNKWKMIIGHKRAPFSISRIAYFYNSFAIVENTTFLNQNNLDYRFSKESLSPFSFEKYTLWLPPENPILLKEYESKLQNTPPDLLLFQMDGCPANCEICQNTLICLVCRSQYQLTSTRTCKVNKGYAKDEFYLTSARHQVFGKSETIFFQDYIFSNFMTGFSDFSLLIIDVDFDKSFLDHAPAFSYVCYFRFFLTSEVIVSQLKWRFCNLNESPYNYFETSKDNYNFQVIKKNDPIYDSLESDYCKINSVSATFYDPNCEQLLRVPSLKGAANLNFCENLYFDITYKRNMIYASKSIPSNDFYYYQIPVQNSSNILYGKCRNNCNCWDGDLYTSKGYNTCIPDPITNKKCKVGYRLKKYSLSEIYEECVFDVFCPSTCNRCNFRGSCLECADSTFNNNYIDYYYESLFCRSCSTDCLACSSSSTSDCHCHKDQFGLGNPADFDPVFHLCYPEVKCPVNCIECSSSDTCDLCRSNLYFDPNTKTFKRDYSKFCSIIDKDSETKLCFECLEGNYLTEKNVCRSCPSNCLHCLDSNTCIVCNDHYAKYLGKCFNYSPFIENILKQIDPSIPTKDYFDSFERFGYQIIEAYNTGVNAVINYSYFLAVKQKFMYPMTKSEYLKYLESFLLEDCDESSSFRCNLIQKQYFIMTSEVVPKLDKTLSTCEKLKRIGLCTRCIQDYHFSILEKKCVLQNLSVEKIVYKSIQQSYEPVKCKSSYFLNHKTKKCVPNILHCLSITKEGKCKRCELGYAVSIDKKSCSKCPSNCISCADLNNCLECVPRHFIFSDKGKTTKIINKKKTIRTFASLACIPVSSAYQNHFVKYAKLILKDTQITQTLNYAESNATNQKNMKIKANAENVKIVISVR